jgi:hypothetical protein
VFTTDNIFLSKPNCFGVLGQTFQMVSCGASHALDNQDAISRSLTYITVVKGATEALDFHGVDTIHNLHDNI